MSNETKSFNALELLKDTALPYVIKSKPLMAPGIWKGFLYTKAEIKKAFENTDWASSDTQSFYLNHEDKKAEKWIGKVLNFKFLEETGEVLGDLYVYDLIEAIKFKLASPDFGISAKVAGREQNKSMMDFVFKNFSYVTDPAVKLAYINNSDEVGIDMLVEMLREWDTAYINDLPDSSFAVIETDYKEGKIDNKQARHLPYKDKNGSIDLPHLRNALARVNQIKPVGTIDAQADLIKRALEVLEPAAEKYLKKYEENKGGEMSEEIKATLEANQGIASVPDPAVKEEKKPEVTLEMVYDLLKQMNSAMTEMTMQSKENKCKPEEIIPEQKTMSAAEVKPEATVVENSDKEKIELEKIENEKKIEQELMTKKQSVQKTTVSHITSMHSTDEAMCNFLKGRL